MPRLGAGLPNIDSMGAGREQPLQLLVLSVRGPEGIILSLAERIS